MNKAEREFIKKLTVLVLASVFCFEQMAWAVPIDSPSPLRLGSGQAHPSPLEGERDRGGLTGAAFVGVGKLGVLVFAGVRWLIRFCSQT